MADQSLESILGYVPLTGRIQSTTSGVPDPLPPSFSSIIKPTIGDEGRYTQVDGTRTLAKRVEYGAPPTKVALKGVSNKDVKLIHTKQYIEIDVKLMNKLRNYTNYDLQKQGVDEVMRQVDEFKRRFDNLRVIARLMPLCLGHIYFDSNGALLPTSSGNSLDVDYGVSASNLAQGLQMDGSTPLIPTSWATSTTDIGLAIRIIKKTASRRTGYPIKYAFYGEAIPSYIFNNDKFSGYLARHQRMRDQYDDTGEIPDGFFGISKWIPAYEAFYESDSGTVNNLWGTDAVTFTPEPSADWWETLEGTFPVPTTYGVMAGAQAAAASYENVQGMFAYGVPEIDIPAAKGVCGDTFLPVLKVPNAIYALDVTP